MSDLALIHLALVPFYAGIMLMGHMASRLFWIPSIPELPSAAEMQKAANDAVALYRAGL